MNDTAYIITVLVSALLVVFGVAYLLDKRGRKAIPKIQPALGVISRLLLWVSRGVLIVTILALVGSFVLNEIAYARFAWHSVLAYIVLGIVFQITRRSGI